MAAMLTSFVLLFVGGAWAHDAAGVRQDRLIISGIAEAFAHTKGLQPSEHTCLEHNLTRKSVDVAGVGQHLVSAIKAVTDEQLGQYGPGAGISADARRLGTTPVGALLDVATNLTVLISLSTSLLTDCVRGEALEMLEATEREYDNLQYVGGRLLLSGADITHSFSSGVADFEGRQWHRFGTDVGVAMRQALLVNATNGTQLPEGEPEQAVIQQTAEALINGFFDHTSVADIRHDLHHCITGNLEFFDWAALWSLIAQLSINGEQHGLGTLYSPRNPSTEQPKWMGELMMAMMEIPVALSKCSIGKHSQRMLHEAIKSIGYLEAHFQFPHFKMHADEATKNMARAVEAWARWDFRTFGFQVGELLRDFVLLVYPHAYSVDAYGRLQRQLSIGGIPASPAHAANANGGNSPLNLASSAFLLGSVVFSLLVTLIAVRAMSPHVYDEPSVIAEEGNDIERASLVEVK